MDSLTVLGLAIAVVTSVIATTYGLLPDRIDLTFVFAAYGAGTIVGGLIAARRGSDPFVIGRRWGVVLMGLAAFGLVLGLAGLVS